jgi:hypothetical protein
MLTSPTIQRHNRIAKSGSESMVEKFSPANFIRLKMSAMK